MVNLTNSLTLAIHGKSSSYISSEVGGNIHGARNSNFICYVHKQLASVILVCQQRRMLVLFQGVFKNAGLGFLL